MNRYLDMITNDTAFIIPHKWDKGGKGYVIAPVENKGRKLTSEEMSMLLSVYTELLKREEE